MPVLAVDALHHLGPLGRAEIVWGFGAERQRGVVGHLTAQLTRGQRDRHEVRPRTAAVSRIGRIGIGNLGRIRIGNLLLDLGRVRIRASGWASGG